MAIYLRDDLQYTDSVVINTPTGGVAKGALRQIGTGNVYGFALRETSDNQSSKVYAPTVVMITSARKAVATKQSGGGAPTFAVGDTVYYNTTTQLATTNNTDVKIGYALAPAGAADSEVFIRFIGDKGV
jgi:predicted RecA/RadA family phage recombinase